jgi:hypothetical protein
MPPALLFLFSFWDSLDNFTWAGLELIILLPPLLEYLGLQAHATPPSLVEGFYINFRHKINNLLILVKILIYSFILLWCLWYPRNTWNKLEGIYSSSSFCKVLWLISINSSLWFK